VHRDILINYKEVKDMVNLSTNDTTKDAFTQELYRRIESYVVEVERARNDLSYFLGLFHSCRTLWENETGKELPEELKSRAGISRVISVPPPPMGRLQNVSVPEAVFEIMKRIGGPLHLDAIVNRLFSEGFRPNVKDPKAQVRIALIRGTKRGIYKRVAGNTFIIDPSVRGKRYQDV